MDTPPLRLAELVATLALAQDNAFGQPLESQLRSCLLATWIAEAAEVDAEVRETTYWVALLRYIGCTGHAHEVATLFGDEIAIRARTLVHDAADRTEVMGDVVTYATAWRPAEEREEIIRMLQETAHAWAVMNFTSGCEVADMLLARLDFPAAVRDALAFTFERWNGGGFPAHASGEAIPLPMRIVHLSHDMEALGRIFSPERAIEAAEERRDRTYDPALADLVVEHGAAWFARLAGLEPWDAVLALEPEPRRPARRRCPRRRPARRRGLHRPEVALHGRAQPPLLAPRGGRRPPARPRGRDRDAPAPCGAAPRLRHDRRAELDLGQAGAAHHAEFDRVELHPLLTEQMLRRSPALAALNPVAAAHHERCDGSGYHRRLPADTSDAAACILAATEVYVGLTTERADRPAHPEADAAVELRRLEAAGWLEPRATRAVLVAAGHGEPGQGVRRRADNPGGLSRREVDVLALAARGLTTRQIADRLVISPKTADRHIQHIYQKIGVSTRAAAALWAMQNGVVR